MAPGSSSPFNSKDQKHLSMQGWRKLWRALFPSLSSQEQKSRSGFEGSKGKGCYSFEVVNEVRSLFAQPRLSLGRLELERLGLKDSRGVREYLILHELWQPKAFCQMICERRAGLFRQPQTPPLPKPSLDHESSEVETTNEPRSKSPSLGKGSKGEEGPKENSLTPSKVLERMKKEWGSALCEQGWKPSGKIAPKTSTAKGQVRMDDLPQNIHSPEEPLSSWDSFVCRRQPYSDGRPYRGRGFCAIRKRPAETQTMVSLPPAFSW